MQKKITLAYSGGLDTSYCIPYLVDRGYEIHAVHIDTGAFTQEEKDKINARALEMGAHKFESIDIQDDYYQKCLRYLIFGNVLRNNTYPLSVSSERPFQALALLDYCLTNDIHAVAHGSTGAGNDQIRFDLIFKTLAPHIEILSPIRDHALSREEEINYLSEKGYAWSDVQKEYSINKGLWGTSIGGVETLTSHKSLPESAYLSQPIESKSRKLTLTFHKGELAAIDGKKDHPLTLIKEINEIASSYAIGRDIHVGDTIIGIKGRVGFEAGGPLVIIKAHELLEKHTLTKYQQIWKKQLADWYGMMLHEGQYMEPMMRNIEGLLTDVQKNVTGDVTLSLHPYRFSLEGVNSDNDLMRSKFGTYGEENIAWSGEDAKGFINILSNPGKIYFSIHKNEII